MNKDSPLFGPAIVKLTFMRKKMLDTPGFTFVYNGILRDKQVTNDQVDEFIKKHREVLVAHMDNEAQ